MNAKEPAGQFTNPHDAFSVAQVSTVRLDTASPMLNAPLCNFLLRLIVLICVVGAMSLPAGEANPKVKLEKETKEEEPKEEEFKYSAWSAFRDLSNAPLPRKDPKTTHSRPGSTQWIGYAKRGQWVNIVLELKNTTEKTDFKGTASIRLNPLRMTEAGLNPYTTSYRQEFEIGPQSTKQYTFSVMYPENGGTTEGIPISITANGRTYQERLLSLHDLDSGNEDLIVVVSEKAGAYRGLTNVKARGGEDSIFRSRVVAVVEPRDLPSRWHDLTVASLIVIDGPPSGDEIKEEQWAALKSYVQAGGHILITAGKNPAALKSTVANRERSFLEELAGITVKQSAEVQELNGGESRDLHLTLKPEVKLSMIDVTVNPGGNFIVQRNKSTQLVERSTRFYGFGSVTFLPFSLSDPVLPESWEGRTAIPVGILDRAKNRTLFSNKSLEEDSRPVQRDAWGNIIEGPSPVSTLPGLRHALDESFSKDTPVKPQEPGFVLSFLLFYLLVAVPGNYFIFGWFKRREIAWLAVPIWATSFSVLAYTVGYMGQTGQLTVNEVSIIEAGSGQNIGTARTFVGLYAPRRDTYTLQFPLVKNLDRPPFDSQAAPGHLLNIESNTGNLDSDPDLQIVDGNNGLSIERLLVQQRSTRRLEVVHRARLGEGLKVKVARDDQNNLSVDVENKTGFALYSPVLINEGKAIELSADEGHVLPDGGSRSITGISLQSPERKDINAAFFGKVVRFPSARGAHARKRAEALNGYVCHHVGSRTLVCAWIENPDGCLPVVIGGNGQELKRPKLEGLTLLLVPVTPKATGSSGGVIEKLKIQLAPDFVLATNQATWIEIPNTGVNLKADTLNAAPVPVIQRRGPNAPPPLPPLVAYLSVGLPARYRELSDEGLRVSLRAKLDAAWLNARPQPGTPVPALGGDITVEVRRFNDNGSTEWVLLNSETLIDLKLTIPQSLAPVGLPINNHRCIMGNTIQLKVTFIPNDLADRQANQGVRATLKFLECKLGRGEGN